MSAMPWPIPDRHRSTSTTAYLEWLAAARGGQPAFLHRCAESAPPASPTLRRWPTLPLASRLAEAGHVRPFLNFLMLHGYLHPGYDYLLERRLTAVLQRG